MTGKIWVIVIASILMVNVADAQSAPAKLLIGKWNVESLTPQFPDGATDKVTADGKKEIAGDLKNFKKSGFTFSADGTVLANGKKFHWVMDKDGKTVIVTREGKAVTTGTILELTDHRLVFTRPDDGMVVTYVLVR